jgi:lauroyl/myristoyl acyltransferase
MLAHAPGFVLRLIALAFGRLILLIPRRRRIVFSNLHHAFPDRSHAWRVCIARASCVRLVETGMLSLASPFLSDARIRKMVGVAPEIGAALREHVSSGRPLILGTVHLAYWESLTWLGTFCRELVETGVIFRPLDNPALNAWVRTTRERHGMRLLSRRTGLQDAFRILRRGGIVSILFDQNAGTQGALSLFMDRVCSTTELPGMLAEKFGALVHVFYARRTGFWRVRYEAERIESDGTAGGVTLAMNRWLEKLLASDAELCASWLWSHRRWHTQDGSWQRMRLGAKRDLLDADLALRGLTRATMPRRARYFITMPETADGARAAAPLLRRLRMARPDAEITLLVEREGDVARCAGGLFAADFAADRIVELPARASERRGVLRVLRGGFPDVHVLFADSARADRDAAAINAPQRFGMGNKGRRRPRLTHLWELPEENNAQPPALLPGQQQWQQWKLWWMALGLPADDGSEAKT